MFPELIACALYESSFSHEKLRRGSGVKTFGSTLKWKWQENRLGGRVQNQRVHNVSSRLCGSNPDLVGPDPPSRANFLNRPLKVYNMWLFRSRPSTQIPAPALSHSPCHGPVHILLVHEDSLLSLPFHFIISKPSERCRSFVSVTHP